MRPFIHEDFLLETDTARELYHRHARLQPILDFHCHLDPAAIADGQMLQGGPRLSGELVTLASRWAACAR